MTTVPNLQQRYPENAQGQHLQHEEDPPNQGAHNLAAPEESVVDRVYHTSFAWVFKPPLFFPALIDLTPPSQSDQESACDVLDHPEVEGAEDDDDDEGGDVGDEVANQQVEHYGCRLEAKSSNTGHWMPGLLQIEAIVVGSSLRLIRLLERWLYWLWRRRDGC